METLFGFFLLISRRDVWGHMSGLFQVKMDHYVWTELELEYFLVVVIKEEMAGGSGK